MKNKLEVEDQNGSEKSISDPSSVVTSRSRFRRRRRQVGSVVAGSERVAVGDVVDPRPKSDSVSDSKSESNFVFKTAADSPQFSEKRTRYSFAEFSK